MAKQKLKNKIDIIEVWFKDKFLVMEYSFDAYDKLKKLLKSDTEEKELIKIYTEDTEKLFSGEPEPLSRRNTAYYIWGHLKNTVSRNEKKRMFGLLEKLDGDPEDFQDIKREFHKMIVKYKVDYLLKSSYFDEILDR